MYVCILEGKKCSFFVFRKILRKSQMNDPYSVRYCIQGKNKAITMTPMKLFCPFLVLILNELDNTISN